MEVWDNEPRVYVEKSRTMMLSWVASAWAAHKAFETPATRVIFQSEDEDRAVHDVDYVKVLWENTDPAIRDRYWALDRPMHKQAYNRLELANGSSFVGLVGDPNKIRSEHPTVVIFDEAAHMTRFGEAWDNALATKCLHVIAISSAEVGEFRDSTQAAIPCAWPVYVTEEALV